MTQGIQIRLTSAGGPQVAAQLNEISKAAGRLQAATKTLFSAEFIGGITAAFASVASFREILAVNTEIASTAAEAARFGLSTEALSSFQYAMRATGVEQSRLSEALKGYVEKAQSQGRVVGDLSEELMRQADVFARMPDGPAKTALAMNLFGEAGIALIPTLNRGEDGLRELSDEARRFGIVIDTDAAKAAKGFKLDMERLNAVFEGVKRSLVVDLTPAFSDLAKTALAFATLKNPAGGGQSWLKQAADDVADGVRSLGRRYLETKGFVDSFVASLIVTGSWNQAINQGIADSNRLLDEYDGNLARLTKPMNDIAEDAKAAAGAVNYLQRAMANANGLLEIRSITARGDNSTEVAKRSEERAIATKRMAEIQRQQMALEATRPADMGAFQGPDGRITQSEEALAYQERDIALMREKAAVQAEMNALGATESTRVWTQASLSIQDTWGSLSQQMASNFASVFNGAIASISTNITGLILQTKTWGQALLSIGTTILTSIVQAIVEMGVRWVMTQIFMATVGKSIAAASVAANAGIAAAQSLVWATPATLATIASYGSAAAVAPGAIALAQGTVMAQSLAAFADGGWVSGPGGPRDDRVMARLSPGEFVVNASAASRHAALLDAINSGSESGSSAFGYRQMPAGGSGGTSATVILVDDMKTAVRMQMEHPDGQATIQRINRRGRVQAGMPT